MDGSAFDRLVRRISEEDSRRGLLRSAFATTVAGLGAASVLATEDAEAKSCMKKCQPSDTDTIGLRQPCTESSQCQGNLLCDIANSQNSCPGQETGKFCCVQTDVQAPCDDGCDCCGGDVICNGGYCQSA